MSQHKERMRIINAIEKLETRARKAKLGRIATILKKILTDATFLLKEGGDKYI